MTTLDKDISRESTIKFDGREIQVTLTEDQKVSFKLKGMKSGVVSIDIEELYKQLIGEEVVDDIKPKAKNNKPIIVQSRKRDGEYDGGPMVPLNRLRTMVLTTKMDLPIKLELEGVLCELLREDIKI